MRDPVEEVALVAQAKRELLLRVHRRMARPEDLEDCFSQATLELVAHARRGGVFTSREHLAHTLELRFLSRVRDLRRALSGRSPMRAAIEGALPLGGEGKEGVAVVDPAAGPETLVILRHELHRVQRLARELTPDQRLALACQLGSLSREAVCREYGWTAEKYRKVAQRGRARLGRLMAHDRSSVPRRRPSRD